jgi:hypothetical protein
MVEIGDDLYVESTRDAVFTRVTAWFRQLYSAHLRNFILAHPI